jgi:hypothetical protein
LLYELLNRGLGPRLMKIGRPTLISSEAAAEWRARMEARASLEAPAALPLDVKLTSGK